MKAHRTAVAAWFGIPYLIFCLLIVQAVVWAPEVGLTKANRIVAATLTALFFLVVIRRTALPAAYSGPDGVKVVNPLRTIRIAWTEIDQFSLGSFWGVFRTGMVDLKDGRRVHIWGIQPVNLLFFPKYRADERAIEELNQELIRYRGRR